MQSVQDLFDQITARQCVGIEGDFQERSVVAAVGGEYSGEPTGAETSRTM